MAKVHRILEESFDILSSRFNRMDDFFNTMDSNNQDMEEIRINTDQRIAGLQVL